MANNSRESTRGEYWRGLIGEQERSGQSVRCFCRERRIGEHSFYMWRRKLPEPVRFALVETGPARRPAAAEPLELILATGERLLIGTGTDGATLRTVLEALRA